MLQPRRHTLAADRACLRLCLKSALLLGFIGVFEQSLYAQPLTPPPTPNGAGAPPAAVQLDIPSLLEKLRDPQTDASLRVQIARQIFDSNLPTARNQLRIDLATSPDPTMLWAILRGVSLSTEAPPMDWVPILVDLLSSAGDPLLNELTQTLSRYGDPSTLARLSTVAVDGRLPTTTRVAAINALSIQRTRPVAATLIQLIEPMQPAPVRQAALSALTRLSGRTDLGHDFDRWRQWWLQQRNLSNEEWQRQLFENMDRQREQLQAQVRQMELRLVETQRSFYRSSPVDKRPSLLAGMLSDPLEAVRLLGINLCELAVGESGPTIATPELRSALLTLMDDALPELRQRATLVLRDLADPASADKAAAMLLLGQEKRPELLRAYLLLLTRMPRSSAVVPAIELLSRPDLQREAALFLTTAAMANPSLLNKDQHPAVLRVVREALLNGESPDPAMLGLLAQVGEEQDWQRLENWLDHGDTAIQQSAASIWAASARPLAPLLERADNPLIYPILLDAAQIRGHEPALLAYLSAHPPQDTALRARWQSALLTTAARTTPAAVLEAHGTLAANGEPLELRISLLTAALDQLFPEAQSALPTNGNNNGNGSGQNNGNGKAIDDPSNPGTPSPPANITAGWTLAQARIAAALLLARAQTHWEDNQPRAAMGDARRIEDHQLQGSLTTAERRSWALLMTRCRFTLGQLDNPALYARLVVEPSPSQAPRDLVDDLTTLFLETAKKQLPEYPQRARTLMVSLLDVLQGPPADPHQPLWAELEKYTGSIIATPAQGNTAPTATTQTVP